MSVWSLLNFRAQWWEARQKNQVSPQMNSRKDWLVATDSPLRKKVVSESGTVDSRVCCGTCDQEHVAYHAVVYDVKLAPGKLFSQTRAGLT